MMLQHSQNPPKVTNRSISAITAATVLNAIVPLLNLDGCGFIPEDAEASLPQLTAVSGPYYRWSDFTAWAETIYAEHPVL